MYQNYFKPFPAGIQQPTSHDDAPQEPAEPIPQVDAEAVPTTTNATQPDIPPFDIDELSDLNSFFCTIVCGRRQGKTTLCEHLVDQHQKSKKPFTHIFLVSGTGAGFYPGVPKRFRSSDMSKLDEIEAGQKAVKQWNQSHPRKEWIKQKTLVIVDDCATSSAQCLRNSAALERAALNGRHWGHGGGEQGDPMKGNGVSYYVLSQSYTACTRRQRLNTDVCFCGFSPAHSEQELLLSENGFFTNTGRGGKQVGREFFRSVVNAVPYRFLAIMNFKQGKTDLSKYVRTVDAVPRKRPRQWFGTASDDDE